MITGFILGCIITAFAMIKLASYAVNHFAKKREYASAIYCSKDKCWKVRGDIKRISEVIEYERKFGKPGAVKYID